MRENRINPSLTIAEVEDLGYEFRVREIYLNVSLEFYKAERWWPYKRDPAREYYFSIHKIRGRMIQLQNMLDLLPGLVGWEDVKNMVQQRVDCSQSLFWIDDSIAQLQKIRQQEYYKMVLSLDNRTMGQG